MLIDVYFLMVIFTLCIFLGMSNPETNSWKDSFLMVIISIFWPASLGFLIGLIIRKHDKINVLKRG